MSGNVLVICPALKGKPQGPEARLRLVISVGVRLALTQGDRTGRPYNAPSGGALNIIRMDDKMDVIFSCLLSKENLLAMTGVYHRQWGVSRTTCRCERLLQIFVEERERPRHEVEPGLADEGMTLALILQELDLLARVA